MKLMALALLIPSPVSPGIPQDTDGRWDTRRETFAGGFSIEHETFADNRLGMHVASRWEAVRLIWTSPDGKVRLTVDDDGYTAAMIAEIDGPVPGRPCLSRGSFALYGAAPAGARQ